MLENGGKRGKDCIRENGETVAKEER